MKYIKSFLRNCSFRRISFLLIRRGYMYVNVRRNGRTKNVSIVDNSQKYLISSLDLSVVLGGMAWLVADERLSAGLRCLRSARRLTGLSTHAPFPRMQSRLDKCAVSLQSHTRRRVMMMMKWKWNEYRVVKWQK